MREEYSRTIDAYDSAAGVYARSVESLVMGPQIERFLSSLRGIDVLDLGCGSGRDLRVFSDFGFDVVGVDLCEALVDISRRVNPYVPVHKMDMLALEFPDSSFDGVWACGSYVHLKKSDFPVALAETCRVLRPGGVLFASLKKGSGESWHFSSKLGVSRFFAFYSLEEAAVCLSDAAFDIFAVEDESVVNSYHKADWMRFFCRKS